MDSEDVPGCPAAFLARECEARIRFSSRQTIRDVSVELGEVERLTDNGRCSRMNWCRNNR